jgi:hypothetical protein
MSGYSSIAAEFSKRAGPTQNGGKEACLTVIFMPPGGTITALNTPGIAFTPLPTLCHGRILGWFAKVVLPEMYHFMG